MPTSTTPKRDTSSGAIGSVARVTSALRFLVVLQHAAVIHLVDVVAAEDDHVLGLFAADGIDVLIDRIRGAHVPVGAGALHGRQQFKELAQFLRHDARPAFADMTVERERLVLGKDEHPAQAGIDAVGERDVDDAVVSAEGHGWFGAVAGKRKEPFSGSARKQNTQCVFHVRMSLPYRVVFPDVHFSARTTYGAVIRYGVFQRTDF